MEGRREEKKGWREGGSEEVRDGGREGMREGGQTEGEKEGWREGGRQGADSYFRCLAALKIPEQKCRNVTIFTKFSHFKRLYYPSPFANLDQSWQETVDSKLMVYAYKPNFKTGIWDKFWNLGGFCILPPLPMMARFGVLEQTHGLR